METIKSKSQLKRDAEHIQQIGIELVALSSDKLDKLPLEPNLRKAIDEAKRLKSHGAVRRQALLIGKLIRGIDSDAILNAYQDLINEDSAKTAFFHELEIWRTRFIAEDKEALTEFIEQYHPEDIQQLRQLIKKAIDEHKKNQNLGASKALFRYLRSSIS